MTGEERAPSIPRTEVRLTVGLALVTLLAINVGGWVFYAKAGAYMERVSRKRLVTVAKAVAAQIDRERILSFEPGAEGSAAYRAERQKLIRLRDEAELDNVFLVAPYLGNILDTRPNVSVGDENPLVDMDSPDLAPLWEGKPVGLAIHEIAGERFQSAFVPVVEENELRAVVGVDASARFLADLEILRHGLTLTALLSLVVASGLGLYVYRSTSRLVALQGEIKNAEKLAALGTLTAGLAHEIRNPLAIIRASAELVEEEEKERGEKAPAAATIVEEVDRLSDLLGHFLEFAKPAGLRLARADIIRLVSETVRRVEVEFDEKSVHLRRVLPDGELIVPMDSGRIVQVLLNLLLNARDAVGPGGNVEVSVAKRKRVPAGARLLAEQPSRKGYAEVRVADDGGGVPDDLRHKLFDPFFTTKEKGTGLGLSIVHGIVQNHEGYLLVANGWGRGTSIGFGLPLRKGKIG